MLKHDLLLMVAFNRRRTDADGYRWEMPEVQGTRHAYYFLRKVARSGWFDHAVLYEFTDGKIVNKMTFTRQNIKDEDKRFRSLIDRTNLRYDLTKQGSQS